MGEYNEGARGRAKRLERQIAEKDEEIASLIDGQADTREALEAAEQRAQRAEAAISDALSIIEGAPNTTVYTAEGSPAIGRWVNGSDVGPILRAALATPPPEGEPLVHIWSGEHGAWWRPNSAGYTPSKHEAGLYPMSQAQDIIAGVGDEKGLKIVTVSDAPHTPEQADDPPRRIIIDRMVPAETAIRSAVEEVEKLPPDTRLTEAVNLLGDAQSKVADYVDGVASKDDPETDGREMIGQRHAETDQAAPPPDDAPHTPEQADDPPRRIIIDRMVPAETAIRSAVEEVEKLPPDTRLTEAVNLLGDAQSKVADYVDGVASQDEPEQPGDAPAVPVSKYGEHSADVVADSNWSAGARFGWNCAIAGDKERLERAIQSRIDERAAIAAAPTDGRE